MDSNQGIVARFLIDDYFRQIIMQAVARQVYDQIRTGGDSI